MSANPTTPPPTQPPAPMQAVPDGMDVRIVALLLVLAITGVVVYVAYKKPALGTAIGIGAAVLVAPLLTLGWNPS